MLMQVMMSDRLSACMRCSTATIRSVQRGTAIHDLPALAAVLLPPVSHHSLTLSLHYLVISAFQFAIRTDLIRFT